MNQSLSRREFGARFSALALVGAGAATGGAILMPSLAQAAFGGNVSTFIAHSFSKVMGEISADTLKMTSVPSLDPARIR